jgi:hypothetical protein
MGKTLIFHMTTEGSSLAMDAVGFMSRVFQLSKGYSPRIPILSRHGALYNQ